MKGRIRLNRIILMGRLTKNPDVRVTPSGEPITRFSIAVNRPYKNQEGKYEADFINAVAFKKTAEIAGNNLNKGNRVLVEGRLEIRQYQAKDGTKRSITQVVADRIEFIESKAKGTSTRSAQQTAYTKQEPMQSFGSEIGFDEEIPF